MKTKIVRRTCFIKKISQLQIMKTVRGRLFMGGLCALAVAGPMYFLYFYAHLN